MVKGKKDMNDTQVIISFAAITIAILLRTLLPSLKKLQAGASWDHTYTATAILAFITSFASAAATFQTFTIPENVTSILGIVLISFVYGWGLNDVLNTSVADLQTPSTSSTSTASKVTSSTQTSIGSYMGWAINIVNGYLVLYPPATLVSDVGRVIGLGSVIGYDSTFDFLKLATQYIDATLAAMQNPNYHAGKPAG
jgi:hypothetical protein